ncbi:MAG TPA: OmpH family outer membrane protein [Gemmatimonadales bacterium]|nr:OmpH family outer membrane protein [Gemmatimonadales bacterium]
MISVVRRLLVSLAIVSFAGAVTAAAQQPVSPPGGASGAGTLRIAFVKARTVLQSMPGYAKAESTYAKEAQSAQAEADRMQASWDSTIAAYRQSMAMLSASAKTAREKALQAQSDTLQSKLQKIKERVDARERELLTPMQTRLQAIIDGIRAEGNFAAVVDLDNPYSQNIVSYDKSLDITERVVRRLQQSD